MKIFWNIYLKVKIKKYKFKRMKYKIGRGVEKVGKCMKELYRFIKFGR